MYLYVGLWHMLADAVSCRDDSSMLTAPAEHHIYSHVPTYVDVGFFDTGLHARTAWDVRLHRV